MSKIDIVFPYEVPGLNRWSWNFPRCDNKCMRSVGYAYSGGINAACGNCCTRFHVLIPTKTMIVA
jgi:hypothetical protein